VPAELDAIAAGCGCELEFMDVLTLMLPAGDEDLRPVDFCTLLSAGESQLKGFLGRGELALGRAGKITAGSLAEFLRRRRFNG
jgi:hypothetical protein